MPGKEAVMTKLDHHQGREPSLPESIAMDDYDPDEGSAFINEVMAEDDAKDPYLETYQSRGPSCPTR
jgi:hypothetical protein